MFFREKLKLTRLPVSKIQPNPSQPRKEFREEELSGLAESIRENGLLQPVTPGGWGTAAAGLQALGAQPDPCPSDGM